MKEKTNAFEDDVTCLSDDNQILLFKKIRSCGKTFIYSPKKSLIFEHEDEIKHAIEKNLNDFSLPPKGWVFRTFSDTVSSIDSGGIPGSVLSLNPTEACNLRCGYCYFDGHYENNRVHNKSRLLLEEMKTAVDMFLSSAYQGKRAIYFFGGEPLMMKHDVLDCIRYIRNIESDILIQIATNGLYLEKDLVSKLSEFDVYINISYDGPYHARNRPYINGKSSASDIEKIIHEIIDTKPSYYSNRVSLNCVVPPTSTVSEIVDYYANSIYIESLYLDFDLILPSGNETQVEMKATLSLINSLWDTLEDEWSPDGISQPAKIIQGFNIIHKVLHTALLKKLRTPTDGKLCTIVGSERAPHLNVVVVRPKGVLNAHYEVQNENYVIGNLSNGIDKELCQKLSDTFVRAINHSGCRECWAAPLCTIDFNEMDPFSYDQNRELFARKKDIRCAIERQSISRALGFIEHILDKFGPDDVQKFYIDSISKQHTKGIENDFQ